MPSLGVLSAIALIVGALCGVWTTVAADALLWFLPPLLLCSLVSWRLSATRGLVALLTGALWLAGAVLGADARERALHPRLRALLDAEYGGFAIETLGPEGRHDALTLRFELKEDASENEETVSLRAAAQSVLLNGVWRSVPDEGVWLTVGGAVSGDRLSEWRAGRTLLAPVAFRRPARYLNVGVPDFERDLALDGTVLFGSVKSGLLVQVEQGGSVLEEAAASGRAHVRRAVARWVTSHDAVAGAIVIAVLIGDRTGLPDDVRARLQSAGTYHVIAISGGNIAILAGLVVSTLMMLGVRGRPAAFVTLCVLIAYSQVVTAGPSVWRATLMAVLYFAARLVDHRIRSWHAMAVAAAIMVVARPLDVRDPGFILTFGATSALLEGARWAGRLARRPTRVSQTAPSPFHRASRLGMRWVLASLVASLAVELILMPVSAQAFSRVTIAGVVLNLLAVPLMAIVQISGIALALFAGVDALASPAGWMACASARGLVESARLVDVVPGLTGRVPSPGFAVLFFYYSGLALLLWPRPHTRGLGGIVLVSSAIAIVSGVPAMQWPFGSERHSSLRLTVFDVGQAEALLLQTAGAGPLVIDAGGTPFGSGGYDVGSRVLAPALWALGIRAVETLLITHGDPDHLGGAAALIDDFGPRQLWTGVPVPTHEPTRVLLQKAARAGVTEEMLRDGHERIWGRTRIRVLHPAEPDWERPRVRNDDSVVIEVLYGDVALLLTGDIGAEVERSILPRLTPARLRILKVAHHGSRTSSSQALLEAWRPQVAVISCGRANRFGHPTREVLERLESIGARVLRTDREGQITIETDGRSVKTSTFVDHLTIDGR